MLGLSYKREISQNRTRGKEKMYVISWTGNTAELNEIVWDAGSCYGEFLGSYELGDMAFSESDQRFLAEEFLLSEAGLKRSDLERIEYCED